MVKLEAFVTTIQIYDDKEVIAEIKAEDDWWIVEFKSKLLTSEQLRKVAEVLDKVEKDKMNKPEYLQA